jgi:hypothetical protein
MKVFLRKCSVMACLVLPQLMYAQTKDEANRLQLKTAYADVAMGFASGGFTIYNVGLVGSFNNKRGGYLGWGVITKDANSQPLDFYPPYTINSPERFSPKIRMDMINMRYAFIILTPHPLEPQLGQVSLEVGPSILHMTKPVAYTRVSQGGWKDSNYQVDFNSKYSAGLSVNCRGDMYLYEWIGVGCAFLANINSISSFVAFELSVKIGALRSSIPDFRPYKKKPMINIPVAPPFRF